MFAGLPGAEESLLHRCVALGARLLPAQHILLLKPRKHACPVPRLPPSAAGPQGSRLARPQRPGGCIQVLGPCFPGGAGLSAGRGGRQAPGAMWGFRTGFTVVPMRLEPEGARKNPGLPHETRSQDMPRSRRYLGGLSGSLPACHPGSALPPGPGEPVGGQGGLVPRVMRAAVAGRMGTGKRERQEKPQMPLSTKSPVVS